MKPFRMAVMLAIAGIADQALARGHAEASTVSR